MTTHRSSDSGEAVTIQRYKVNYVGQMIRDEHGDMVYYNDHINAVTADFNETKSLAAGFADKIEEFRQALAQATARAEEAEKRAEKLRDALDDALSCLNPQVTPQRVLNYRRLLDAESKKGN